MGAIGPKEVSVQAAVSSSSRFAALHQSYSKLIPGDMSRPFWFCSFAIGFSSYHAFAHAILVCAVRGIYILI